MQKIFIGLFLAVFGVFGVVNATLARVSVRGYTRRSTGTYVAPHYRTSPNSTRYDNYSTRGNYNPYTGRTGYTSPYKTYRFR